MGLPISRTGIGKALADARERTLAAYRHLPDERLSVPFLSVINPPLWELGHIAWFEERWCLRRRADGHWGPSLRQDADALYDSAAIPHAARWSLPLPDRCGTLEYMAAVRDATLKALEHCDEAALDFFRLALFHEDMHDEALWMTLQTLAYPVPLRQAPPLDAPPCSTWSGDAVFDGGEFLMGASRDSAAFVFDNERWRHPVRIEPFRMARRCVSNGEFLAFVEDGGYQRRSCWDEAGWTWRSENAAEHPLYWRRVADGWQQRRFDRWTPLAGQQTLVCVSAYEADAWCRWAGRRLPSEGEWEFACRADLPQGADHDDDHAPWGSRPPRHTEANLDDHWGAPLDVAALPDGATPAGLLQMLGNVWEWTATAFAPYPGFVAGPYMEYSAPWFHSHRVLRGGSFATRSRLVHSRWRNFYQPDRRDAFAGFRSCALSAA
ncbi:MAG: ergothioneine biosynthesis protein EgtB [Betaproteobacteria bacterium]|nr:ergothioneine biosynthesis protein EgtB [Betaproteobacteria bacterium]